MHYLTARQLVKQRRRSSTHDETPTGLPIDEMTPHVAWPCIRAHNCVLESVRMHVPLL